MSSLYTIIATICLSLIGLFAAFRKGQKAANDKADLNHAKAELAANERVTNAKSGTDSDSDNISSLRDFAAKHGKR